MQPKILPRIHNGAKTDGEWTYSIQACKEEFLANYPEQNNLENLSQLTYIELFIVLLPPVVLKRGNHQIEEITNCCRNINEQMLQIFLKIRQ
jgi:hypothetical protein